MAVYFIKDVSAGRVKIGLSKHPWARLMNMQTGSASELQMLAVIEGGIETERELHQRFASLRTRGEWFVCTRGLAEYVASLPPAVAEPKNQHTRSFWNGMTAADVSKATGLSKSFLCEIQSGLVRPSPERALLIQRATGVSAIKLVFGDGADEALAHVPHLGSKAA